MSDWTDQFVKEQFKGSSFGWTHSMADHFAKVDIETLLFDEYFLNTKKWLWGKNADIIIDLWNQRDERYIELALVLGSIGNGKTSILSLITWLLWFEVTVLYKPESLYTCPQEYFGLRPTSKIAFIALSKTKEKAKKITFSEIASSFKTGFNKDYFPPDSKIKSELVIPRNNTIIFPNTATQAANLGYNVYCLSGNQKVKLSNGDDVALKELDNCGEFESKGFDVELGKFVNTKADNVIKTGRKEVFEVTMEDGSKAECTKDHEFLVIESGLKFIWDDIIYLYKPLNEIKDDDRVITYDGSLKVMSFKSLGVQDVYDVINSETSNFMLSNGVIVSNSAVVDEAAFLEVIEDSKKSDASGEIYDQAESVYHATKQRMRSRFGHKEKGMIVMISSINTLEDFIMSKAKQEFVEGKECGIYCSLEPEWNVKPKDLYYSSGKHFYFDTEKLKIIEEPDEIAALDEHYKEVGIKQILFGDNANDSNDLLLEALRQKRKIKEKKEEENKNAESTSLS